jgi:hypothetical protein
LTIEAVIHLNERSSAIVVARAAEDEACTVDPKSFETCIASH